MASITEKKLDRKAIRSPSDHLVKHLMATSTLKKRLTSEATWYQEWEKAFRKLWHHEASWPQIESDYQAAENVRTMQTSQRKVEEKFPKNAAKDYIQADRDAIAGQDADLFKAVPEHTIYLALDRNNEVLYLHFHLALQFLHEEATVQRIIQDIYTSAHHEPPPYPDKTRHPRHDLYLNNNSQFCPEVEVCGVYHIGAWPEKDGSISLSMSRL